MADPGNNNQWETQRPRNRGPAAERKGQGEEGRSRGDGDRGRGSHRGGGGGGPQQFGQGAPNGGYRGGAGGGPGRGGYGGAGGYPQRGGFAGGRGGGYSRALVKPKSARPEDWLPRTGQPLSKENFKDANTPMGWGNHDLNETTYKPPIRVYNSENQLYQRMIGKIQIETNHVETKIYFPERIYHYEVVIKQAERTGTVKDATKTLAKLDVGTSKKPARAPPGGSGEIRTRLWQKIVKAVLPRINARHQERGGSKLAIASDCSKALYTTQLIRGNEENYVIESNQIPDDDAFESNNAFIVEVNITKTEIDTAGLTEAINDMLGKKADNLPEIEQIYNIVLKTLPSHLFIPVGRASFFSQPETEFDIGGGLVNWPGFSSIYTFGFKPFINIDIANTAFIKGGKVLDILRDLFKEEQRGDARLNALDVRTWGQHDKNDKHKYVNMANDLLKTVGVTYDRPLGKGPISKRVVNVLQVCPADYKFKLNDGTETDVEAYFRGMGVPLQHKYAPCLELGNGKAVVPAEICIINKGQSYNKKLQDYQTAQMIKDTAKPPRERRQRILDSMKKCDFQNDEVLKEFGVTVPSVSLLTFQTPHLLAPQICYGLNGEQRIEPRDGVWNVWDYEFSFVHPGKVAKFQVLFLESARENVRYRPEVLKGFLDMLIDMSGKCGMVIPFPAAAAIDKLDVDGTSLRFQQNLKMMLKKYHDAQVTMALVVIPKKGHQCYNFVKKYAELETYKIGLLTQCVAYPNVARPQRATVGNLLFKMNAKLDGINHVVRLPIEQEKILQRIDFLYCPTLIIGADVTHPSGIGSTAPSVAAVTASLDYKWQKFMMTPQVQARPDKSAAEVIDNFGAIVKPMIMAFKAVNNVSPRRIIIYRDGVGDGQYGEVLCKEMKSLRDACGQISPQYQPKITFLTVQKRHKTRFFPKEGQPACGKSGNAFPGTLVDQKITHPTEMDFYLLSHQGIQGTSRPTRYHLLWDDSDLTATEIHNMTYNLCYGYNRCNRAVSIPAPTYYAHLAAYRVRCVMEALNAKEDGNLGTVDNLKPLNDAIRRDEQILKVSPMHFI